MRQHDSDSTSGLPADACRTLELLAAGLDSREVAARLECPVEAVRGHLALAIRRLGATSKLDAILKAAARGLIRLQPC